VYGTLVYPSFFNVYVYFSGYGSVSSLSQGAGVLNNLTFAIYPVFILGLFALGLLRILHLQVPSDVIKLPTKLRELRTRESTNMPLVFSVGFVFVFVLLLGGFALPVIQAPRILEVLCIGAFPISGQMLAKLGGGNPSKKKMLLMFVLVLFVVLTGAYRYYSQIQRRVLGG
jgi:hypothetical protein